MTPASGGTDSGIPFKPWQRHELAPLDVGGLLSHRLEKGDEEVNRSP